METDDVAACFEGPILRVYVATDTNDLVTQVDQASCKNDLILQLDATCDTSGLILTTEVSTCTNIMPYPTIQLTVQEKNNDCTRTKHGETRPNDTIDHVF